MPNITRGDRMSGLVTYLVGGGRHNEHTSRTLLRAMTRSWRGTTTPS